MRRTLGGLIAVLLTMAACTAGPQGPAAPTDPPMDTERLVLSQAAEVSSLDGHLVAGSDKIRRISEALLKRDPVTQQPGPGLATAWKQVDALTWDFTLRPGVTFSNGEPFTAQTVKYNFERINKAELRSPLRATFMPLIDTVTPQGENGVRIKTKTPLAMFLERLTSVLMVPEQYTKQVGDAEYGLKPIGTGPYVFKEWVQGQHVTLERNEKYWGPKPIFRTVVYRQIVESATSVAELLNGGVQLIVGLNPQQEEAVKATGKHQVVSYPAVDVLELRYDVLGRTGPNPFQDKRVRQAASHAINVEAITKNLLGGHARPVATNIVPEMFGHDPSVKPYPYDPAKAKQLLAAAGYPNGFEVRFLWFPGTGFGDLKPIVEAIAGDLAAVGIKTTLFFVAAAQISQYTGPGKAGPMFIGANANGGFYDGGFGFFFLRERFTSSYYWSNDLEQRIVRVESSTDPEERKRILSEIQKMLHEEAPYTWLYQGFDLLAADKRLDLTGVRVGADIVVEALKQKR